MALAARARPAARARGRRAADDHPVDHPQRARAARLRAHLDAVRLGPGGHLQRRRPRRHREPGRVAGLRHVPDYAYLFNRVGETNEAVLEPSSARRRCTTSASTRPTWPRSAWWNTRRMLDLGGRRRSRATAATITINHFWADRGILCFWIFAALALAGAFTAMARRAPWYVWAMPDADVLQRRLPRRRDARATAPRSTRSSSSWPPRRWSRPPADSWPTAPSRARRRASERPAPATPAALSVACRARFGPGSRLAGGSCRRTRPQTPQAPSEGRVPRHPPEHRPCPAGRPRPRRGPRALLLRDRSSCAGSAAPCSPPEYHRHRGLPPRWRANGALVPPPDGRRPRTRAWTLLTARRRASCPARGGAERG